MKTDFIEFISLWFDLQKLKVPKHQKKIAGWLEAIWHRQLQRQALLMAFRNSGKSTIVGLFCAWILYQKNETRILVIAADHQLAKKMVRNVKRIIEQHPLTSDLKPPKRDQWASEQFTINRDAELRDPSMLAKGLSANLTGLRADVIICDDVEVPKNCDTSIKREDLREKLQELDYILTPSGMQLYIGTPHTYYTIYRTKEGDKKELEPFLLGFEILEIPILDKNNQSAWPERFSNEKIASLRSRSGENKFLSQMMLKPVNIIDSILDPDRLSPYTDNLEVSFANNKEILKLGDKRLLSVSCWWDPSFAASDKKGDSSVVACVFTGEDGKLYLHDLEYITIQNSDTNAASQQCNKVIDFLERNHIPSIRIEANGVGKFLPSILKETLKNRKLRIAVLEEFSHQNKQLKILEAFEVLLAERALNVNRKIWQTPFIDEMREWSMEGNCHDDGLDAVAGCLISEPIRYTLSDYRGFKKPNWQGLSTSFTAKTNFEI